jgi:hypothetical protein
MSVTDPIVTFVPILVIGIVAGILFDRLLVRPDSPLPSRHLGLLGWI